MMHRDRSSGSVKSSDYALGQIHPDWETKQRRPRAGSLRREGKGIKSSPNVLDKQGQRRPSCSAQRPREQLRARTPPALSSGRCMEAFKTGGCAVKPPGTCKQGRQALRCCRHGGVQGCTGPLPLSSLHSSSINPEAINSFKILC